MVGEDVPTKDNEIVSRAVEQWSSTQGGGKNLDGRGGYWLTMWDRAFCVPFRGV